MGASPALKRAPGQQGVSSAPRQTPQLGMWVTGVTDAKGAAGRASVRAGLARSVKVRAEGPRIPRACQD